MSKLENDGKSSEQINNVKVRAKKYEKLSKFYRLSAQLLKISFETKIHKN